MTAEDLSLTATKIIKKSGNSLTVYLTTEIKLLGLKEGDAVEISIKKVKD